MGAGDKLVIAVSANDLCRFGCPYCGYRSGTTPIHVGGSSVWKCGSEGCGNTSCVLSDGVTKSTLSFDGYYPSLQEHPRHGIPSHGNKDVRPGSGGEFFRSRGIGLDRVDCFVCGTRDRDGNGRDHLHNIAAFVRCREAGERVVTMFACGAHLDYRDFEPDRVQVKVGACDFHLENLRKLNKITHDGIITPERVHEAKEEMHFLDSLQEDVEKLHELLKSRESENPAWNGFIRARMTGLHSLLSKALGKK